MNHLVTRRDAVSMLVGLGLVRRSGNSAAGYLPQPATAVGVTAKYLRPRPVLPDVHRVTLIYDSSGRLRSGQAKCG
jgi:hypothetical protein